MSWMSDLTAILDYHLFSIGNQRLNCAIDAAFRREGVTIPFPQRDLHLKTVAPGTGLRREA